MDKRRLLIATRNPAKLAEWKRFLGGLAVEIVGLDEVGITVEVKETGETFLENARIKAVGYARVSGHLALGDDGGFEIDFLGGAPGVRSRRLFGEERATDEELIEFILQNLSGVPSDKRGAQLRTVAVVAAPDGSIICEEEAVIRGIVADKPSPTRLPGFPYRSIFFLPQFGKMFSDLTDMEHEQLNYRRKVALRIANILSHDRC